MAKNRTEWPKEYEKRSELIKQLRQRIKDLERIPNLVLYWNQYITPFDDVYKKLRWKNFVNLCRESLGSVIEKEDDGD